MFTRKCLNQKLLCRIWLDVEMLYLKDGEEERGRERRTKRKGERRNREERVERRREREKERVERRRELREGVLQVKHEPYDSNTER